MKKVINIRGMDCSPKVEDKFNKWYNEAHIPMLLKCKAVKAVTRLRRIGNDPSYPKYLVIYEYDSQEDYEAYSKGPELAAALEEMNTSWPNNEGLDFKWRAQYETIKSWENK